jgi:hypothetical protein
MKRKNNKENAVICFKNNIFEASQTRKNNIMKGYTAILNRIVPVMFLLFAGNYAAAQCTIQYSGAECVGSPIQFLGASTGTTHDWDFNELCIQKPGCKEHSLHHYHQWYKVYVEYSDYHQDQSGSEA